MSDFSDLALSPRLLAVVGELGYERPTPIQLQAIPVLIAGRDLVAQSKTGSGKTAAFALPILESLILDTRALQALVVCPTRELSSQVAAEFRKLGRKHDGLVVRTLCGGEPVKLQTEALARGVHVAVGTPGRLLDLVGRGNLETKSLRTVVLDEADRMLDMGFQEDVETILASLPAKRQTALFSATFPDSIEAMIRRHQPDAVRVAIDDSGELATAIRQLSLAVEAEKKNEALRWVLGEYASGSALVFCNFKATIAEVVKSLASAGVSVDCLHGDLDQFHRDQVLAKFRNGSVRVLVASDVAGRGIDVEQLGLVVNYQLPDQPEIYLHRIGRTGRAGNQGVAISLVTSRDRNRIDAIEATTEAELELIPKARLAAAPIGPLDLQSQVETLLISGGRKDKLRPGDILGALVGVAGLEGGDVGKIEVRDKISYAAVSREHSRAAARKLNAGRIKKKRFRVTIV